MGARAFGTGLVVMAVLAVACGSSTAPGSMGTACASTTTCTNGLQCLPAYTATDGGCTSNGMQCLQACDSNGDCGILGNYSCFATCGGAGNAYCAPD